MKKEFKKFFYWDNSNSHLALEFAWRPLIGLGLRVGQFGSGITLHIGFFLQMYITLVTPKVYRFALKHQGNTQFDIDFKPFIFKYEIHNGLHWRPNNWRYGYLEVRTFLLGHPVYSLEELKTGHTFVDMPEKKYAAYYKILNRCWKYPRWPWIKKQKCIEIEIPGGIPVPGKGENSYDCGDDAIFSSSFALGEDEGLQTGLDRVAMDVMKTRQKYASLNWKPEKGF